jgi:hypothetical protein
VEEEQSPSLPLRGSDQVAVARRKTGPPSSAALPPLERVSQKLAQLIILGRRERFGGAVPSGRINLRLLCVLLHFPCIPWFASRVSVTYNESRELYVQTEVEPVWESCSRRCIMGIVTLEGVVEKGQIRLKGDIRLPEKTKVYVIVPDIQIKRGARIFSPRLAHPEQAVDFEMEVIEESPDASV